MRFPSLFRLPRHQQFDIKPRYYDPIKEEIRERTERIKGELEGNQSGELRSSRIEFKRKAKTASMTSMLQLAIAAGLGLLLVGWLQYGSDFFYYFLWLLVPGYLFYRLKNIRRRR